MDRETKKVAYAVLSGDGTLTFFYDDKKDLHSGSVIYELNRAGWRTHAKEIEKVVFDDSFANYTAVDSTVKWFWGCENLRDIVGIINLKTDNVVNMAGMWYGCKSLTSLDLSSFNTEKVHSMDFMFLDCSSLVELDVSSFNTGNVTSMMAMFSHCSALSRLDLSGFNTENVKYMSGMFELCTSLVDLDINNFITKNVISNNEMFYMCPALKRIDLSKIG